MTSSRLVFFDLETAGLNSNRHPIIQIAAIATDANLQPVEAFEAKIRFDERKAKKHSLRKNHFQKGVWAKEAREEAEVARVFAEFLRRHTSVSMLSAKGEEVSISAFRFMRRLTRLGPKKHQPGLILIIPPAR